MPRKPASAVKKNLDMVAELAKICRENGVAEAWISSDSINLKMSPAPTKTVEIPHDPISELTRPVENGADVLAAMPGFKRREDPTE